MKNEKHMRLYGEYPQKLNELNQLLEEQMGIKITSTATLNYAIDYTLKSRRADA